MSLDKLASIGGIAWPNQKAKLPGWVCTLDLLVGRDDKMLAVISGSYSSNNVLTLCEFASASNIQDWYSDVVDKRAMTVLSSHRSSLPVSPAPYVYAPDAVSLYLQILTQAISEEQFLYFGKGGKRDPISLDTQAQLADLRTNATPKIQEYPALAALSFVVSAAYLWYRVPEKEIVPGHAEYIISCVEGKKEYEPWAERFLLKENEVNSNGGNDLW